MHLPSSNSLIFQIVSGADASFGPKCAFILQSFILLNPHKGHQQNTFKDKKTLRQLQYLMADVFIQQSLVVSVEILVHQHRSLELVQKSNQRVPPGNVPEWDLSQLLMNSSHLQIGQKEGKEITGHQADPRLIRRHMHVPVAQDCISYVTSTNGLWQALPLTSHTSIFVFVSTTMVHLFLDLGRTVRIGHM